MLDDATSLLAFVFSTYLTQTKTIVVFLFVSLFTLSACLMGYRQRVFSRAAVTNTLATFAVVAVNLVLIPVVFLAAEAMRGLYAQFGIPSIPASFWMATPWLIVVIVALVTSDFADYWSHRLLHTKIGWPIHAVHHSDTHVNGFTALRVHALEIVVMKAFYIIFLTWIGIPSELIVTTYIFASMHNAYVHLELDIDHGPFNWLLASPRFHRWHHADFPAAYGKNLANMMPIWDRLFGTYYEAGPCAEKMGAESDGIPATDPAKLVLLPFVLWYRQAHDALGAVLRRAPRTP